MQPGPDETGRVSAVGISPGRILVRLLGAFCLWSVVGWLAFPAYARLIVLVTSSVLDLIRPHEIDLHLALDYPRVVWSAGLHNGAAAGGTLPFRLLVYNTVLYLALLSAFPGMTGRVRTLAVATGLPIVVLFHVVDLGLTVESRVLSVIQPEHYDLRRNFGLWFSLVKFYNFFSIMALKQVVFVLLFYMQWVYLRGPKDGRVEESDL